MTPSLPVLKPKHPAPTDPFTGAPEAQQPVPTKRTPSRLQPVPKLPVARTGPRRQRERAVASIGSDQLSSSRAARTLNPPPSLPASAGPIPRSPPASKPPREPVPKAAHVPKAALAEPPTPRTPKEPVPKPTCPQTHSLEPLKPVPAKRTPSRLQPVPKSPVERTGPRRQRERAVASIGSDHPLPSRAARTLNPPPSLPASAGPIPRSPPASNPPREPVPKAAHVPKAALAEPQTKTAPTLAGMTALSAGFVP